MLDQFSIASKQSILKLASPFEKDVLYFGARTHTDDCDEMVILMNQTKEYFILSDSVERSFCHSMYVVFAYCCITNCKPNQH